MKGETHSTISNETTALQKLGFDNQRDNSRTFASILNRLRQTSFALSIILEIVAYFQVLAIGFYVSSPGLLDGNTYTTFIQLILVRALDFSGFMDDQNSAQTYFLVGFTCLLFVWVIFYLVYISVYKSSKTFYPVVINILYFLGYHIFFILSVIISTTCGFFLRPLFLKDMKTDAVFTFLGIAVLFGYIYVLTYMVRILQSSPDVDIKNRLSFWPQDYVPRLYKCIIRLVIPFFMELFRDNGIIATNVGRTIIILSGIGGIVTLWSRGANIFPAGKIILSTEYVILIVAPCISLLYHFFRINALYYLLIFIILVVGIGFALNYVLIVQNRKKIDMLYLKFEELTEKIQSPNQCIELIKMGLIYNAPCINNHTLLNWAISRWPNHQPLLLMVSFIFYVIHMPYREILDLVSVTVDIAPFGVYDGLLFYQIFNRLPTQEHLLMRRLDGVRRLYDLPKSSLRNFWEAVLAHHWDEAIVKSATFKRDLDHLNQIFSHLIFENPSSECVMQEFIKFATDIQGNYSLAYSAQKELNCRIQPTNEARESQMQQDGESVAMSKLSSIKSSIFLSEFSENAQGFDKVQNGIQAAVLARPIFWPNNFLICVFLISLFSFAGVVASFVVASIEGTRLDNQVSLAARVHECALALTQILCTTIEFTTHNEDSADTVSGVPFDAFKFRSLLNDLSNNFDELLVDAFSYHTSVPKTFLELWVNSEVNAFVLSPITGSFRMVSLMEAIRIYQMKARTLAFSPDSYIGNVANPSPEIKQITYMYSAVCEVTNIIILAVADVASNEIKGNQLTVILSIVVCLGVSLLVLVISIPVVIFGMMREFDFFVSLYSAIPTKIVKKMLHKESEAYMPAAQHEDNNNNNNSGRNNNKNSVFDADQLRSRVIKKSLPIRLYHTWSIVGILFLVFIITPIPVILTAVSYVNHVDESQFVMHGLQLSSEMISSFGLLCLYSFRLVTAFPSVLTPIEEKKRFMGAATTMLEKYTELFFGGTDFFVNGLVTRETESADTSEEGLFCPHLLGHGKIQHNCTKLHDDVYYIYGLCKRFIEIGDLSQIDGMSSNWWRLFYPVASNSLNYGINDFYTMFVTIAHEQRTSNTTSCIIALSIGIVLFIAALSLSFAYSRLVLSSSLKSLLKPIMIMELGSIAESPLLMRFLQGDYDNHSRQTSRTSRTKKDGNDTPLIDFILEGVLVTTVDGTIIASNKKYHELFQNTAEEVLGLNVMSIFPSTLQPLFDALQRAKSGGVAQQNVSVETMLFSEDDREIQVKVSFVYSSRISGDGVGIAGNNASNVNNASILNRGNVGIRGNRGNNVNNSHIPTTCAFIITDRSDLINAQQQLRREKANVEALLDSILPHNIAVSLLNGQTEISFEVDCACVLFSDIVSFTPMCSTMTAKQIMNTLNMLFTEFDTELSKFRRVTKLKTIGDAYVCAAGIFDGDGPIEDAAVEIVTFGTRMQEIIPILNEKHGYKIHMRIGIYTGGPLICGVLGKEKPLFEIIGQAVTIAEDLEATSLHDKIHISQSTADLVQPLNLRLTERGDNVKVAGLEGQTWTIN